MSLSEKRTKLRLTQRRKKARRRIATALEQLEQRQLLAFDISLLANINQLGFSSFPEQITEFNNEAYFVADDGRTGSELWRSDGTLEGTEIVADLLPGFDGSQPSELTVLGDELFFKALDQDSEFDLWKVDSTGGTVMVFDANASQVYYPLDLTASGDKLFFTAYEYATGYELWAHDTTTSSTAIVRNINPDETIIDRPQELTDVNGTLFFTSYESGYDNRELWKSDGTSVGTVMVRDIGIDNSDPLNPDLLVSSNPYNLTNIGGTLFFVAEDFELGIELFKSDGNNGGTMMVQDLSTDSSYPQELTEFNGEVFFSADAGGGRQLYKSDGNTIDLVAKTSAGIGESSNPGNFAVVGNNLFFASEGSTPATTARADNPVLTPNNSIRTGSTATIAGIVTEVTLPDRGFVGFFAGENTFTAEDQDGSSSDGPGWVGDQVDIGQAGVGLTTILPGDMYITDLDGLGSSGELAEDYWDWVISDPTGLENINFTGFASGNEFDESTEGLVFEMYINRSLTDINNGVVEPDFTHEVNGDVLDNWFGPRNPLGDADTTNDPGAIVIPTVAGGAATTEVRVRMRLGRITGTGPYQFTERLPDGGNEAIVMNATLTADLLPGTANRISTGRELHKYDAVADQTTLVKDIGVNSSSDPSELTESGGSLFFSADEIDGAGRELWVSDGTEVGTVRLVDSATGVGPGGPNDGDPQDLTDVGGVLFFSTRDDLQDRELWTATSAGASLVTNINPATRDADVQQMLELNNLLYFVANDGINGEAVWSYDPVAGGAPTLVSDANPSLSVDQIEGLTKFENGLVYYNPVSGINGGIYYFDGSTTTELGLMRPIPMNGDGDLFIEHLDPGDPSRNAAYFVVDDSTSGEELWRSDGTVSGTQIVQDLVPGTGGSVPRDLLSANGYLFFAGEFPGYGRELLYYSPNVGGIALFQDFNETGSSNPDQFTMSGNSFFFTADNGITGRELWRSTGQIVADINPSGSSNPTNLTDVNGVLYFTADNGITGSEPYMTASGAPPIALGDVRPGPGGSNASGFKEVNGAVFFSADSANTGVLNETFLNINGTSLASLRSAPNYPGNPDETTIYEDFEAPTNVASNFGRRMRAYFQAPVTDNYTFWIASDDQGELLLSTDTDPANAVVIANVPQWSSSRQWDKFPEQQSVQIPLIAGQSYFIEAEAKEGGGGDNLAIAYGTGATPFPTVIPGELLVSFGGTPGDQGPGRELWSTDGTAGSAQIVTDLQPGLSSSDPITQIATDHRMLFSAVGTSGTGDRELYTTDGTEAGTILIEDLFPGVEFGSNPTEFVRIGDDFFFVADDGLTGTELYQLQEIAPVVAALDVGAELGVYPPEAANQHSTVESVTLTFDEVVTIDPAQITLRNRNTNQFVTTLNVNSTVDNGSTFVEITFDPGTSVITRQPANGRMHSLEDGNYELIVPAAAVQSLETGAGMEADMIHGAVESDMFFAFFGARDNDRDLDFFDFGAFGLTFRLNDTDLGYDEYFDLQGNGNVDFLDYGFFGQRWLQRLDFV